MKSQYKIIDISKLSYDKALKRIQEITQLLENNSLDLNEALKCYKESNELINYCQNAITEAEKEIKKIKIINDENDLDIENEEKF